MRPAISSKYDGNGTKLWTRQYGTVDADYATAITADSFGNIYVAGYTENQFPGEARAGGADMFVAKYDVNGNRQWLHQLGSTSDDFAYAVATDLAGNVYVAGATNGAMDGSNAGGFDLFLVKYDGNGTRQWTRQYGSAGNDYAYAVACDGAGSAIMAGSTEGSLGNTNAGGADVLLAGYYQDGNPGLLQQFGTASADVAQAIAINSAGDIYVAGSTKGVLTAGQSNAGGADLFLTKFTYGYQQWTLQLGSTGNDYINGLTTDAAGGVYAVGYSNGALFGPAAGNNDLFILKSDGDGNKQWGHQLGTINEESARAITAGPSGNLYVAGTTFGALDGQPAPGGGDLFILKFQADGRKR